MKRILILVTLIAMLGLTSSAPTARATVCPYPWCDDLHGEECHEGTTSCSFFVRSCRTTTCGCQDGYWVCP